MIKKSTIVNLLNYLIEQHRDLTWKLDCCYSNGKDLIIYKILINSLQNNQIKGNIQFNSSNGEVLTFNYLGFKLKDKTGIVDLLLDLCNYERTSRV